MDVHIFENKIIFKKELSPKEKPDSRGESKMLLLFLLQCLSHSDSSRGKMYRIRGNAL
jgi:hypothetical protein